MGDSEEMLVQFIWFIVLLIVQKKKEAFMDLDFTLLILAYVKLVSILELLLMKKEELSHTQKCGEMVIILELKKMDFLLPKLMLNSQFHSLFKENPRDGKICGKFGEIIMEVFILKKIKK